MEANSDNLSGEPWVTLSEALTWIAFGDAMAPNKLRAEVEGHRPSNTEHPEERAREFFAGGDAKAPVSLGLDHFLDRQSGLEKLAEGWKQLRDKVDLEAIKVRGRYTSAYSIADARLADVVELNGNVLATFSQFDVSKDGIRRQPNGSPDVLWWDDPNSFDRELHSFLGDMREADGYLLVEVKRAGLLKAFPRMAGEVPPNRKLNHDEIIGQAASLLAAQPGISLGSAATSIVADLPRNPKTGKLRDARHIERIIAHLWGGL